MATHSSILAQEIPLTSYSPCYGKESDTIEHMVTMKVKVTQSCPTLHDPMDCTAHQILQARILEWVAFLFSRGSSQPRGQTQGSCIVGEFFTHSATREAHMGTIYIHIYI